MTDVAHILRFKLLGFLKRSSDWNAANVVKHVGSFLVFGGFAYGAYLGSAAATSYLLDTARLGLFLLHRFLSMLLFVFFMSVNVGNLIVSYAALYRSSEMQYFLTKPVSHTNLFVAKFLDNFFYSCTAFFLLALSVLLGYGSHFHLPWTFYVGTMLLMLIPFMLMAGCVAVTMLLALMRFVDRIGVRWVVAVLVCLYLGSMYAYFSLTNPMKLVTAVTAYYPRVDQYLGQLDPAFAKYLPNQWIAESLYWTVRGDSSYALSYTLLLLLGALASFLVMVAVARKVFYRSWLASLNLRVGGEPKTRLLRAFSLLRPSHFHPQLSVLVKKEFWQFVREPSQWIHLGIITMLMVTFVVSVAQINLRQTLPLYQTISYMVVLLFNAFLIASIALRFVYPSWSVEGANFWVVLASPVRRRHLFWMKFLVAFVPILLLSELLVLASHHSLMGYPVTVSAASLVMLGVVFALVALNLGAGAFFSDARERDPIKVASSQSATLTFLVSILYLTVIVAVIVVPYHGYFSLILRQVPFNSGTLLAAVVAALAISGLLGGTALAIGLRTLRRDF